jgi:hypothetical protein
MGYCRLRKLHRSEITSGSWDAPDYPACSYTSPQKFGHEG